MASSAAASPPSPPPPASSSAASAAASASLLPDRMDFVAEEQRTLALWARLGAFQRSLALSAGRKEFTFYDGPPFATGLPHYGHILAGFGGGGKGGKGQDGRGGGAGGGRRGRSRGAAAGGYEW